MKDLVRPHVRQRAVTAFSALPSTQCLDQSRFLDTVTDRGLYHQVADPHADDESDDQHCRVEDLRFDNGLLQRLHVHEIPPVVASQLTAVPSTPPAANSNPPGASGGADGQGVCTRPLNVLVACEYSGRVREAFRARGHNAMSVDLLPTEVPGRHFQGDIFHFIAQSSIEWDILIAHPPCTHLAVSGSRWFPAKRADGSQQAALDFVRRLLALPIKKKALENPVSIISSRIRKPDQIVQPWMFGHGETKATCFWLEGLPPLKPTAVVQGREAVVHRMPPGPDRWKDRSRTYLGVAAAMADQWGRVVA